MSKTHPGLELSKGFLSTDFHKPVQEIFDTGFTILENHVEKDNCSKMISELDWTNAINTL